MGQAPDSIRPVNLPPLTRSRGQGLRTSDLGFFPALFAGAISERTELDEIYCFYRLVIGAIKTVRSFLQPAVTPAPHTGAAEG